MGLGAGCTDPLLLNYDPFVCPNPVCKSKKGNTLGILSCGCIMCDLCIEKPFNMFTKQENGKCPMCEFKVFKEQSRTKIGGAMLRNKVTTTTRYTALHRLTTSPLPQRPKALDEWNDPHLRGEQLIRKDIYEQVKFCAQLQFISGITREQLDDETFREIHMPLRTATKDRAGAACTDDAFTIKMREWDNQILRLKRK